MENCTWCKIAAVPADGRYQIPLISIQEVLKDLVKQGRWVTLLTCCQKSRFIQLLLSRWCQDVMSPWHFWRVCRAPKSSLLGHVPCWVLLSSWICTPASKVRQQFFYQCISRPCGGTAVYCGIVRQQFTINAFPDHVVGQQCIVLQVQRSHDLYNAGTTRLADPYQHVQRRYVRGSRVTR